MEEPIGSKSRKSGGLTVPGRGKQRNQQSGRRRNSRYELDRKLDQIQAESKRRGIPAMVIIRIDGNQYQIFEGIPRGLIDLSLD